jgi:orotidine-5'-phosphate decarboxylase
MPDLPDRNDLSLPGQNAGGDAKEESGEEARAQADRKAQTQTGAAAETGGARMIDPRDRLIIALDKPSVEDARKVIDRLGSDACFYKIGYQLMPVGGIELARALSNAGKKIFLDFKFHDIGATVERGVKSVVKLGGDFLTVHAEPDVLKGAVAGRSDDKRLKILGVTVLTSLTEESLADSGIAMKLEDLVLKRAEFAAKAGADGVIASAREAAVIKKRFGTALLIVTPGVRPAGVAANDQARVVTPAEALKNGGDYLVVGRPIIDARDPANAARAIVDEMRGAIR